MNTCWRCGVTALVCWGAPCGFVTAGLHLRRVGTARCWPGSLTDEQPLSALCAMPTCARLCFPVDCSLPGSSVHGVLQTRTPAQGAIPFSLSVDSSSVNYLFVNFALTSSIYICSCKYVLTSDFAASALLKHHFSYPSPCPPHTVFGHLESRGSPGLPGGGGRAGPAEPPGLASRLDSS